MFDLFDVPWSRVELDDMRAFFADAGDEGVTWEVKADDERGRLHPDSLAKAACGLANQIGGYVLVGAKQERSGGPWTVPGITPPRDEPGLWIGKVLRGLNPIPRFDAKVWTLNDARLVAAVQVEPVARTPCMTRNGRIYERVSGETLPVEDPALLDRLFRRGDAARKRAETFAQRAARRGLDFIEWSDARAVGIALALAPIGRQTDDITSRLFVGSFRDAVMDELVQFATWRPWGAGQPPPLDLRQQQDAITVAGHYAEGFELVTPGSVHHHHRTSWLLQATWDGAVVASASFSPRDLTDISTVESVISRGWRHVVPLAERLGGYGPAHVSIVYAVTQPRTEPLDPPLDQQPLPPKGAMFERLPATTWIGRETSVREPTEDDLGSVHRELQRAAGITSDEPDPTVEGEHE